MGLAVAEGHHLGNTESVGCRLCLVVLLDLDLERVGRVLRDHAELALLDPTDLEELRLHALNLGHDLGVDSGQAQHSVVD